MKNEDIAILLDAKLSGFKAEIKSGNDMAQIKLDNIKEDIVEMKISHKDDFTELKEYQKTQNSRTSTLESETKIFRLIHRNPKASIVVIVLLIAGLFVLTPILIKFI